MKFIFVTASGRETENNPLLKALVSSGVRDMLVSYYFLTERKANPIHMYAGLRVKR